MLLEHPGPWGPDALEESRLPAGVGRRLRRRARQLGARPLLIRRPGRSRLEGPRRLFVVASCPTAAWAECHVVGAPAEVLDLDLAPLRDDEPTGGEPLAEPLYLVCTHGRHDRCCAEFGRPLAAALTLARPAQTWECSHIGGDRFAGNLLSLPDGRYFGHVPPAHAARLVGRLERGMLDLAHFRGRSCYPYAVQAAEWLVRDRERLDRIDDVRVERFDAIDSGVRVWLHVSPHRRLVAEVAVVPDAIPRRLTCAATTEVSPPRFRLVDVRVEPAGPIQPPGQARR
jgi:hypothetical protein